MAAKITSGPFRVRIVLIDRWREQIPHAQRISQPIVRRLSQNSTKGFGTTTTEAH